MEELGVVQDARARIPLTLILFEELGACAQGIDPRQLVGMVIRTVAYFTARIAISAIAVLRWQVRPVWTWGSPVKKSSSNTLV